jgi:hypothetical protein
MPHRRFCSFRIICLAALLLGLGIHLVADVVDARPCVYPTCQRLATDMIDGGPEAGAGDALHDLELPATRGFSPLQGWTHSPPRPHLNPSNWFLPPPSRPPESLS